MSEANEHPPGEYAIVELLGHTTLVGRVAEVERFGTKMLAIEVLFRDTLLPPVFQGGSSIYRFTPCPAEVAFKRQPRSAYHLPPAIKCVAPPLLLAATGDAIEGGTDDDDERPF